VLCGQHGPGERRANLEITPVSRYMTIEESLRKPISTPEFALII